jgi:twitching motility protein PilT
MNLTTGEHALARSRIAALVERAREQNASDVHVEAGQGAALRVFTAIERVPHFTPERDEVLAFLDSTIDRLSRARLDKLGIADAVYSDERLGSLRIHASRGKDGPRLAIRLLARSIPELSTLGLPPIVESFATLRSGLTIIAGPSGSGKSTTSAAILDRINATSARHLMLFEDPVEYTHRWLRSVVTQYEVGRDVSSYAEGVRGALRADPDVIFIGELRGIESVTACLQAAETGHVVFAALHTPSESSQAIHRLVGLFTAAEQESARLRLADALRGIVGLRLLPKRDGTGLRAAAEVVIANDAVRRLIRDGAVHQLRGILSTSKREGMQTLEFHLSELVASGEIDIGEARAASLFPSEIVDQHTTNYRRRS